MKIKKKPASKPVEKNQRPKDNIDGSSPPPEPRPKHRPYTLEDGRQIFKDGVPVASLHPCGDVPVGELDKLAAHIVKLLNASD